MSTLFVRGINDDNTATMTPGKHGGVNFRYEGCCGIYWYMNFDPNSVEELTLFGEQVELQQFKLSSRPTLVFNEISDPDSHHGALKCCELLCEQLQCPVINHPSKILQTTRDNVSRLLQDIPALEMPVTVRTQPLSPEDIFKQIEESGLTLPVIVRQAGTHGGTSCILVTGREDIDKLHVYPFDGSDFYLTEFVDYVSDDGYYRKYRIVVIDGVPLYRHHLIDKKWMIHASSEDFMQENSFLLDEAIARRHAFDEQTLPIIRPAIDEITKRLQLEYYGIDCNIDEQGNILIFEVNANMNILFNKSPLVEQQLKRIRQHILKLLDNYSEKSNQ